MPIRAWLRSVVFGFGGGSDFADDEAGETSDGDVLSGPGVNLLDQLADRLGVVLDERLVEQDVVFTSPTAQFAFDDLLTDVFGLIGDFGDEARWSSGLRGRRPACPRGG